MEGDVLKRHCEDCANYEPGLSVTDCSGVCLKLTDWTAHELWWVHSYDTTCMLFAERKGDGR